MKSRSTLFFIAGVAVGTLAGLFLVPQKGLKSRKDQWRKSKKFDRAFKETASKYKEKLASEN